MKFPKQFCCVPLFCEQLFRNGYFSYAPRNGYFSYAPKIGICTPDIHQRNWLTPSFSPAVARVAPRPDRARLVLQAMQEQDRETRQKLLWQLIDGFAAMSDFPGVFFIVDFMDMFPDAKIILNQRESAQIWADSIQGSLEWFNSRTYQFLGLLWLNNRLHFQMSRVACDIWQQKFDLQEKGHHGLFSADLYDKYNRWVREEAAKRGRTVLEFQAKDGWRPLCKFLGKPVPSVPFPRLNDQNTIRVIKAIVITRGLLAYAALGGMVYAGFRYGGTWLSIASDLLRNLVSKT